MSILFVSILFVFAYALVYVHFGSVLECYDKCTGEFVEYRLAQAVYLIVVVRSSVSILYHSVFLEAVAALKSAEVMVASLQFALRYKYLHLEYRLCVVHSSRRLRCGVALYRFTLGI